MEGLNLSLIENRFVASPISTDEALKDVTPFNIPDDVMNGKQKIVISSASPISNTSNIGVKVSYV